MSLNSFASDLRLRILSDLKACKPPSEGEFSDSIFRDAVSKGHPQLGATRFEQNSITIEFIYPNPSAASIVLTVKVPSPERIVFLPVPDWVVESIWQGEIDGSFHFETDARNLVADFASKLTPEHNAELFGPKAPTKRG